MHTASMHHTQAVFSLSSTGCRSPSFMSLISGPILHEPVKVAPTSTTSFPVTMSPETFAVDFRNSNSETLVLPFTLPLMSELVLLMFPSTKPVAPTTTFAFEKTEPYTVPSMRMSPVDLMSPSTTVPAPIRLIEETPSDDLPVGELPWSLLLNIIKKLKVNTNYRGKYRLKPIGHSTFYA